MITEDFVTFELAKLLKEKGFDESISMVYTSYGHLCKCTRYDSVRNSNYNDITKNYFECTAPTLQMAKKWLKVVHNIGIFPSTYTFSSADGSEDCHPYGCAVIDLKTYEPLTNNIFPRGTEEDTVEEAIKFCLKNLI